MKVFFSSLLAFVALTFCFNASAQDIIYTIRGEINHQTTALDSISVENLTKQSAFGFGELPELDDYRINLTQNKFWGSTSVYDLTYDNSLYLHENRPGLVSVGYNGQTATNASITLYNVNGQKLLAKNDLTLNMGSLVEVEINQAGVYLLYINTPRETRTFKAIGASKSGQLAIALQSNSATPLKSGQLYHIDNQTQSGDNIKIRVFKNNYVAEPIEIRVEKDTSLVFALDSVTAPTVQTLDASDILMNSATLNGTILNNGNSSIIEYGFYWSATNENPGEADNKIIVDGTTGSFSANLSGLEHATTYYVRAYAINAIGTSYGEQISFITLDLISICDALDNCNLTFTHSGDAEWLAETEVSFNGGSSAQSGSIGHNQQSTLETTVTGPGIVSFYWKVSSQSGYDKLKFYMGTTLKDNISGNVDWELKEYEIPEGSHTLKWRYTKDGSSSGGQDCGWLDKIVFTTVEPTLPTVTTSSITNISQTTASTGGEVTSSGFASITARGVCWNTSENPTISDNKTSNRTGAGSFTSNIKGLTASTTYYVRAYATNSEGTAYGEQKSFTTSASISLGNALDNCNLTFIHSGNAEWFEQTAVSYYGGSSAQSGTISHNQQSAFETTVTGPGAVSFYWKVSSESGYDKLKFYIGTSLKDSISGNVDWQLKEFLIPEGNHTITWNYIKDQYVSDGEDCGRVDKIVFTNVDSIMPTLPTVTTASNKNNTNIGSTSASFGGEVTLSGFASVTARGVCWNTTGSPTIADSKTVNGNGIGAFTSIITELTVNTTYYVRAYAINSKGIAYGQQVEFTTNNNNDGKDIQTAIVDVTNPATGKTWMDRNLGASRAATSSADAEAYGDLYQWGRAADGHQKRNSLRTSMISYTDTPVHGYYISSNEYSDGNWVIPRNNNFWQGVNGVNNPCPRGYRLPTDAEWNSECHNWGSKAADDAFNSPLKLPVAGYRRGYIESAGLSGHYWSSTVEGKASRYLFFSNHSLGNSATTANDYRVIGKSVRCIKGSETSVSTPSLSTTYITNITQTTATSGGDIVSDGGATVNLRGVCWNTNGNPSILDNKTSDGPRSGRWVSALVDLQPNTTYYVRAYATNNVGTGYGEQITFTTLDNGVEWGQKDTQTIVIDVINPLSGLTWMDRNLGATRAATSSTDAEAYGDLYQWGRAADGHQKRNSPITTILSNTDTPGHGNFIFVRSSHIGDWRSPENSNLWQGVNGFNNPCPVGYRLPSAAEWEIESQTWDSQNSEGTFASPLKLTLAGGRYFNEGLLTMVGIEGYYWSSTTSQGTPKGFRLYSTGGAVSSDHRNSGYSVRCLKHSETTVSVITTSITYITQATATSGGNVTNHGRFIVTDRGVCWNTTGNPTIADNKTSNGIGTGSFTCNISGLTANTTYYVRAYATNSQGTSYGNVVQFTTSTGDGQEYTQTSVVDVTNPATGLTWMDRNLGASRVATSSTDTEAYGDLYQWGRAADGHQKRNSQTTSTRSNSDNPGHGSFILAPQNPWNWRSPQNKNLWQGVNGVNNPCPNGYRLPTEAEWEIESQSWESQSSEGAFASPLKLPVAGYRRGNAGSLSGVGSDGRYWSSTVDGQQSWYLYFNSSDANTSNDSRASGLSVRCIKD